MEDIQKDTRIAGLEFEDALKELESIVKEFEDGKATLQESIDLYQRGTQLKMRCEQLLDAAKLKIGRIDSSGVFDCDDQFVINSGAKNSEV